MRRLNLWSNEHLEGQDLNCGSRQDTPFDISIVSPIQLEILLNAKVVVCFFFCMNPFIQKIMNNIINDNINTITVLHIHDKP